MHFTVPLVALCAGMSLAAPQTGRRQGSGADSNSNSPSSNGGIQTEWQETPDGEYAPVTPEGIAPGNAVQPGANSGRDYEFNVANPQRQNAQRPNTRPTAPQGSGPSDPLYDGRPMTPPGGFEPLTGSDEPYSSSPAPGGYQPTNQRAGRAPGPMLNVQLDPSTNRLTMEPPPRPFTDAYNQRFAQLGPLQSCAASQRCENSVWEMAMDNCYIKIDGTSPLFTQQHCDLQLETSRRGCVAKCGLASGARNNVARNPTERRRMGNLNNPTASNLRDDGRKLEGATSNNYRGRARDVDFTTPATGDAVSTRTDSLDRAVDPLDNFAPVDYYASPEADNTYGASDRDFSYGGTDLDYTSGSGYTSGSDSGSSSSNYYYYPAGPNSRTLSLQNSRSSTPNSPSSLQNSPSSSQNGRPSMPNSRSNPSSSNSRTASSSNNENNNNNNNNQNNNRNPSSPGTGDVRVDATVARPE